MRAMWQEQFDELKERRPDLAQRVCRRLLMDMHRRDLLDLDALDVEVAGVLRLGGNRRHSDPNRPQPQLPSGSVETIYRITLEHASRYLSAEDISATILLTE